MLFVYLSGFFSVVWHAHDGAIPHLNNTSMQIY